MGKFLLLLVSFMILIVTSILVVIYGWGIHPVSWGWIIGGGIIGPLLSGVFKAAADD